MIRLYRSYRYCQVNCTLKNGRGPQIKYKDARSELLNSVYHPAFRLRMLIYNREHISMYLSLKILYMALL